MQIDYLDYKAIGKRIAIARIRKDVTQDTVCEKTSISQQHMSNIEKGKAKFSLTAVVGIANALDVSVDELLCDNIIKSGHIFNREINSILSDCTDNELRIITSIIKSTKETFRRNIELINPISK